MDQRALLRR